MLFRSAGFALKVVYDPFLSGGVTVPNVTISTAQAFFTEFLITFNLLFVVTAVATDTRAVCHCQSIFSSLMVIQNDPVVIVALHVAGG